jgi:hypothetical protein
MQLHVTDGGQEEDAQAGGVEHDHLHRRQRHRYVDNSGTDHHGGAVGGAHSNYAAARARHVLHLGWDVEPHV